MAKVIEQISLITRKCLFFFLIILSSCNNAIKKNSPFAVVVKLNSSEELGDFDEAKKYIDVVKVYGKYADNNVSPEMYWRNLVNINNSIGTDKKFTNTLKYFKYDIEETISKESALVVLRAKESKAKIKAIEYSLILKEGNWIVQDILYRKH